MIEIPQDIEDIENIVYIEKKFNQTIVSVDDAWFEGPTLRNNLALPLKMNDGMGINGLINKIKQWNPDPYGSEDLSGDIRYLKTLANACKAHEINLALCNFEYFEAHFVELNQSQNGILLDIKYAQKKDNKYGINLLLKLLKGVRPSAEIVFITGLSFGEFVESFEGIQGDDRSKWLVRSLPTILKSVNINLLETEINYFIDYWCQRGKPVELLYRSFVEIVNRELMHPTGEKLRDATYSLSHCIQLINEFVNDDGIDNESFKALYNAEEEGQQYKIASNILEKHLNYLGIIVKKICSNDNEKRLRMPHPGIFFLILLYNFFSCAEIREIEGIAYDDSDGSGSMELKLRKPKAFKIALEASPKTGTSVKAFKILLSGDFESFRKKLELPVPKNADIEWRMGDKNKDDYPGDSGHSYFFSGLTYEITEETLIIKWK